MGIFNVGGAGVVRVGGEDYRLGYKEALYLGMGDREVLFESIDPAAPAKFYFNSVCAHCNYPDRKITKEDAVVAHMVARGLERARHKQDDRKSGAADVPLADGYDGVGPG